MNDSQPLQRYAWIILASLLVAQLVMSMGAYAWGPLAPFIMGEYGISRARFGLMSSAMYLSSVLIAVPAGILVDRLGARIMLIFCLLAMGLPLCLFPAAGTFLCLVILSALGGVGYGCINQVSTKGIVLWFPRNKTATAMGIKQTGVTLGGALSAILLPVLASGGDWKWSVLLVGASMILAASAMAVLYREKPEASGGSPATGPGKPEPASFRKLLANPFLLILVAVMPFMAFSQSGMATFLVLFLNEKVHLPIGLAGSCLTLAMITGTLGRIAWGLISDTLFKGDRIRPSFYLCLAGAVFIGAMGFIEKETWRGAALILSALTGFTIIGWNALIMALGSEMAGRELAGTYMGFSIAIGYVGILSGPPVFGWLADVFNYRAAWGALSLAFFLSAAGFGSMHCLERRRAAALRAI